MDEIEQGMPAQPAGPDSEVDPANPGNGPADEASIVNPPFLPPVRSAAEEQIDKLAMFFMSEMPERIGEVGSESAVEMAIRLLRGESRKSAPATRPAALPTAPADGGQEHTGFSLPITEVRGDLLICEHGVRYAEVPRDALDHEVEPQPGDRVNFHHDGRMEHVPA